MSQHNTRPQDVSGNILEHCTLAYIYGELLTSDTAVQTDSVETIVGIYNPIISQTICEIIGKGDTTEVEVQEDQNSAERQAEVATPQAKIFIEYRGKCTEDYARALHKCKAPCSVIMVLKRVKTVLP